MQFLIEALRSLQDFIFPPMCPACINRLEDREEILCHDCRRDILPLQQPFCPVCAKPDKEPSSRCCAIPLCGDQLDTARAVCLYENLTRELIHQFKFNGRMEIARPLARMMVMAWVEQLKERRYDCCVPIPLHHSRLGSRGYNQSELLAREICKMTGLAFNLHSLVRHQATAQQSSIKNKEQKVQNVRFAFRVLDPKEFFDREVLLIDDILTSGATAASCAAVLKEAGARRVDLLVFARA